MNTCRQIAGTRGSGKTQLCKSLLRLLRVRRRVIQDPLMDYRDFSERRSGLMPEVYDYLKDVSHFPDEEFSVAYLPPAPSDEPAGAAWLARWALHVTNCTLVIEEAHDALKSGRCPDMVKTVAKRGRHYGEFGVGLWCVSQRIFDIDPDLRAELNAHESCYFRLSDGSDLDVVRKRVPGLERIVATLPDLSFVRLQPGQPPLLCRIIPSATEPVVTPGVPILHL